MTTTLIEPTAGDILRHAATIVAQFGLAKGQLCDTRGQVCELGAVAIASGACAQRYDDHHGYYITHSNGKDSWPKHQMAFTALGRVGGGSQHNDLTTTTKTEAVAILNKAADYADEAGW